MRIAFLLPGFSTREIGGYRTVYIYANYLVKHGHDVTIIYPHTMAWPYRKLTNTIFNFLTYIKRSIMVKHNVSWFPLDAKVKEKYVWNLTDWCIGRYDIIIATAYHTSLYLEHYKLSDHQLKVYYIQDFENWFGISEDEVYRTYQYDMLKIVTVKWLQDKVKKVGQQAKIIRYGLEHNDFYVENPPENRSPNEIMFYWHEEPRKGCMDTLAALEQIHTQYPDIHVVAFGFFPLPSFPQYITYYKSPSREVLRRLYNNASIFVGASVVEGFGLTIGEAMCCGCAIACTDNDGFKEMVVDRRNGLLSPIHDSDALATNICQLMNDSSLRIRLSHNAEEDMKQFSWSHSCDEFMDYLEKSYVVL